MFFIPPWGILYFLFSSFISPEFQFLVVLSYFRSFLYSGIHYPFSLCIWFPPVYSSLSESYIIATCFPSYNYVLLVCVPPQIAGFHGTPVCVFISIPLLVAYIGSTPFFAYNSPSKEVCHFLSISAPS